MEWGVPLPWNFERKVKFCFIGRPCLLGSPETCKRKLCKRLALSIVAPLGNPEGTRLSGTLRDGPRRLWKRNVYLYESYAKGIWREGSFTEYSEGYVWEGYGNGHLSPHGPVGQPRGGLRSFAGDFER